MADVAERLQNAVEGRYRIIRMLGRGGMATVFLAEDLKHHRQVAIKVLHPSLAEAVGSDRFVREIEATSRLEHPHILHLIDSGDAEGVPYFVVNYVEGESLGDRLRRGGELPVDEAVAIACQVADALEHAHGRGVIHRDVKPQNILLQGEHAWTADFGIAKVFDPLDHKDLTSRDIRIGTPHYMSPEQGGDGRVDARSDVYSLGCVLYEMLKGEPPFTGPSFQSIMSKQALEQPPSIRIVRDTVPAPVEAVTLRALAKSPADRYQSAADFKAALQHAIAHPDARARRSWKRQVALGAGALVAVVLGTLVGPRVVEWLGPKPLEASRVLVYPLAARSGLAEHRLAGEDVATIIGHSLDVAGPIQWVEGWQLLSPEQRDDVAKLAHEDALRIARRQRCGHFVRGVVAVSGDSTLVTLELRNTAADTLVLSASAGGLLEEAWRLGIRALNGLLPALIPGDTRDLGETWRDRDPNAVAHFLAGEASFRRGRFADALHRYEDAVGIDSTFALAAARGAQAATWAHEATHADVLIDLALAHAEGLAPKHRLFAEGLDAFIETRADDAVRHLRQAIDAAPDFAVPYGLLGEVYTHLITSDPWPDSLAEAAFIEARRLDPAAVPPLFHLSQIAIRKGDSAWAARLVDSLVGAEPDSQFVGSILLMRDCVLTGADTARIRWAAQHIPQEVIEAGKNLAVAGSQRSCAKRMFRAILTADSATGGYGEGRRWAALVGLQNLLLTEGQADEVRRLLDSALTYGMPAASRLYLLDAAAGYPFEREAETTAARDRERYGEYYERVGSSTRLWLLGLWAWKSGDAVRLDSTRALLLRRSRERGTPRDSALAASLGAFAVLLSGDTAAAIQRLEVLRVSASRVSIQWDLADPLGIERSIQAAILLAAGRRTESMVLQTVFTSSAALILTLYLETPLPEA